MLGYRKFKETNTVQTLTLTLTNTGDLRTIEPSDYRAATPYGPLWLGKDFKLSIRILSYCIAIRQQHTTRQSTMLLPKVGK